MQKDTFKKPSFFIVGAPKSGTTALQTYLREHVEIFMPRGEMNFLSKDLYSSTDYKTTEEYLKAFVPAPQRTVIGEKSVWYLYSKTAVQNILKLNPNAKFIIMVRNPVDMAQSLHSQLRSGEQENIQDFKVAWHSQNNRKNKKRIPYMCIEPKKLQYGEVCKVGEQLEQLYALVPRERVHVIFLDDLKKDALKVYKDVLMFLGVAYDGRTHFPIIRENKVVSRPFLLKIVYAIQRFKKKLPIPYLHLNVLARLKEKSRTEAKREKLLDVFKQELTEYFKDDIQKLSQITGRDLSRWIV